MEPIFYGRFARTGLGLCDFAFVVGKFQIHSPAMDVEGLAQIFGAHGRAFQMPSRETISPGGGPSHDVLWLRLFPKGKILWVALLVLCGELAGVGNHVLQLSSAEFPVFMVFVELEHV